jgi:hypothetical protein
MNGAQPAYSIHLTCDSKFVSLRNINRHWPLSRVQVQLPKQLRHPKWHPALLWRSSWLYTSWRASVYWEKAGSYVGKYDASWLVSWSLFWY